MRNRGLRIRSTENAKILLDNYKNVSYYNYTPLGWGRVIMKVR